MEKSDSYYKRKHYMQSRTIPPMSVISKELGPHLSEAFYYTCPDALKPSVGLTPPLKGAGDDLWISPSDVLVSKVTLKPPLTSKYMKALTHEGILTIGNGIEAKFINEFELQKQQALAELEEMLTFMAEIKKRKAIQEAREEEIAKCEKEKREMQKEFAKQLQLELEKLERRLREEYKKLMEEQKKMLDEEWQEKLEDAVSETVDRLTAHFLKEMAEQEKRLKKKFEIELKKEEIKMKRKVRAIKEFSQDTFLELKHQLECKNISNIMYVLCMERRKCQEERDFLEACYRKDIKDIQDNVVDKDIEIRKLKRELEASNARANLREECVLEILRQFQKFINFTLKACPKQAEFLLSVEKMMLFELTDAICKSDQVRGEQLARKLLKWKSDIKIPVTKESSSSDLLFTRNNHDCYNEVETPREPRSDAGSDYLPAFYFDKHLYVREEFRNMMSQGIKVTTSNLDMWNKDVESLQKRLFSSRTGKKPKTAGGEKEEEVLSVLSNENESDNDISKMKKQTRKSSVYFRGEEGFGGFLFPSFSSFSDVTDDGKSDDKISDPSVIVMGPCCQPCNISQDSEEQLIVPSEKRTSASASCRPDKQARSSIISVSLLGAQDSLIMHRMSVKQTLTTPEPVILTREASDIITIPKDKKKSGKTIGLIEPRDEGQLLYVNEKKEVGLDSVKFQKKSFKLSSDGETSTKKCTPENIRFGSLPTVNRGSTVSVGQSINKRKLLASKDSLMILHSQSVLEKEKKLIKSKESPDSSSSKLTDVELLSNKFQNEFEDREVIKAVCPNYDFSELIELDEPVNIYKDLQSKKADEKGGNVAEIAGDEKATEHLQKGEEFTLHRIGSFLTIFKKHPDLVKIFTPCTK